VQSIRFQRAFVLEVRGSDMSVVSAHGVKAGHYHPDLSLFGEIDALGKNKLEQIVWVS
jgi:hypothetical protein